jgi:hypothetical protein
MVQYWRMAGWYVGAEPVAGSNDGNLFKVSYNGENRIQSRADANGVGTPIASGTELVFVRTPAVP